MLIMQDDFQNHTRNNSHCPMTSRHEFKVLFSSWKIKKTREAIIQTRWQQKSLVRRKLKGEAGLRKFFSLGKKILQILMSEGF